MSAAPLGDYLFACYEPGSNPHCDYVKLKSRPPGAGLSRFDADVGGGGLLPGLALPGLGGGNTSDAEATPVAAPHPDEFWLEASLMMPGPVNLYACRGLASKDAKCTLAINALTFVQREDFGLSKLEAVELGKKKRKTGILIGKVADDSAAAKAELSAGDVIVKAGGFSLYSPLHLKGILAQIAAGKKIKLTLSSGDSVTLKRARKRSSKK